MLIGLLVPGACISGSSANDRAIEIAAGYSLLYGALVTIVVILVVIRLLSFANEARPGLGWKIAIGAILIVAGGNFALKLYKAERERARAHEVDKVMQERQRTAAEAAALDARRAAAERNSRTALIEHWRIARQRAIDQWRADLIADRAVGGPGVVPPMLSIQDTGSLVSVTNRSKDPACVLVTRMAPRESPVIARCTVGSKQCVVIRGGESARWPTLITGNPESCITGPLEYRVGNVDHPRPSWWSESAVDRFGNLDPDPEFINRWSDAVLISETSRLEKMIEDRARVER